VVASSTMVSKSLLVLQFTPSQCHSISTPTWI
jgi:hypothetical protein